MGPVLGENETVLRAQAFAKLEILLFIGHMFYLNISNVP